MLYINEIKEPMEKVLIALHKDKSFLKKMVGDNQRITAENICEWACNHLFNDHPEQFNITKIEGFKIREYFHGEALKNHTYVNELRKTFPEYMEPERERFLKEIEEDTK